MLLHLFFGSSALPLVSRSCCCFGSLFSPNIWFCSWFIWIRRWVLLDLVLDLDLGLDLVLALVLEQCIYCKYNFLPSHTKQLLSRDLDHPQLQWLLQCAQSYRIQSPLQYQLFQPRYSVSTCFFEWSNKGYFTFSSILSFCHNAPFSFESIGISSKFFAFKFLSCFNRSFFLLVL